MKPWHHDIFLSRAFLPHYELQEIMVFLEIRDLFPGSMALLISRSLSKAKKALHLVKEENKE